MQDNCLGETINSKQKISLNTHFCVLELFIIISTHVCTGSAVFDLCVVVWFNDLEIICGIRTTQKNTFSAVYHYYN